MKSDSAHQYPSMKYSLVFGLSIFSIRANVHSIHNMEILVLVVLIRGSFS